MSDIDRDAIRGALLNVLCNASNYPAGVRSHVLGRDMGPLVDKATGAVLAALSTQEAATEVEWGVGYSAEDVSREDSEADARRVVASWIAALGVDDGWTVFRRTLTSWQEVPADAPDEEPRKASQYEVDSHARKQNVSYSDAWRYFEREGFDMSAVEPRYEGSAGATDE